jgi:hypothetical protein
VKSKHRFPFVCLVIAQKYQSNGERGIDIYGEDICKCVDFYDVLMDFYLPPYLRETSQGCKGSKADQRNRTVCQVK